MSKRNHNGNTEGEMGTAMQASIVNGVQVQGREVAGDLEVLHVWCDDHDEFRALPRAVELDGKLSGTQIDAGISEVSSDLDESERAFNDLKLALYERRVEDAIDAARELASAAEQAADAIQRGIDEYEPEDED